MLAEEELVPSSTPHHIKTPLDKFDSMIVYNDLCGYIRIYSMTISREGIQKGQSRSNTSSSLHPGRRGPFMQSEF